MKHLSLCFLLFSLSALFSLNSCSEEVPFSPDQQVVADYLHEMITGPGGIESFFSDLSSESQLTSLELGQGQLEHYSGSWQAENAAIQRWEASVMGNAAGHNWDLLGHYQSLQLGDQSYVQNFQLEQYKLGNVMLWEGKMSWQGAGSYQGFPQWELLLESSNLTLSQPLDDSSIVDALSMDFELILELGFKQYPMQGSIRESNPAAHQSDRRQAMHEIQIEGERYYYLKNR